MSVSPRRAAYVFERNVMVYRRSPIVLLSGFFEPVFYLLSMTIGVGALVGDIALADGRTMSYVGFVAPALLAASAMNGAFYESTYQLFFKLLEGRTYRGILATPVSVAEMALGELAWSVARGTTYAIGFMIMATLAGAVSSCWALAALPAAVLVCVAFAAAGQALTTTFQGIIDIERVQLIALPLFLCSATFFPLATYPRWMQVIVSGSPLYQGVAIQRALFSGDVHIEILGHITYLIAMAVLFGSLSSRRLRRRISV
ncbi:MAG: ABC-type polysaccharide/polyol phosphate export system, permease component [Ilumatobacteraceae bacterium]|nr:ABC-type polysaccharide/polyol phosphate export system, permease component [Ilumatobacteraceae bacterium]